MNATIAYNAASPSDYAWSIAVPNPHSTDKRPRLTSQRCAAYLTTFMHNPSLVAVATEASSHPAGLEALYAQPWLWAGGGLGNMDECPLQTCVAGAGGLHHDSLNFAALCVVPECSANDVAAEDFPATVELASLAARTDQILALGYADSVKRMHKVNKFLGTGWTCGEFVVPWRSWPFGIPYLVLVAFFVSTVLYATVTQSTRDWRRRRTRRRRPSKNMNRDMTTMQNENEALLQTQYAYYSTSIIYQGCGEQEEQEHGDENEDTKMNIPTITPATSSSTLSFCWRSLSRSSSASSLAAPTTPTEVATGDYGIANNSNPSFWSAFDARQHVKALVQPPPRETAILDGLRVGSMLWIMLGHVMAIVSSTGAGFANPQAFLPPFGFTNTVMGQLLFSSRLAVDTFLVISGFLTVHALSRKLPYSSETTIDGRAPPNALVRYLGHLPKILVARVFRILPLYAMCLLFFTQVAPKMGSGPFWYQWLGLLKPCHDYGWTNLLFINNFWPMDQPTTGTCFYHSWYLAVDMQLFLASALLVCWYQSRPRMATLGTASLWCASVLVAFVLAALRHWSANSFDGMAVARYDMEAYAKPHIRAVAYLTGMVVSMILPLDKLRTRTPWRPLHHIIMALTLVVMCTITFCTAFGAYARRPCRYQDWPHQDECGSTWSPAVTWLYTSTSRALWSLGIGIIMYLCLGRSASGNPVASILSWSCWTPLSHLTFGAYLIHPIVIFIWQLGARDKEYFRLSTFVMDSISVGVVSYVAALVAALTVELPCAELWKQA